MLILLDSQDVWVTTCLSLASFHKIKEQTQVLSIDAINVGLTLVLKGVGVESTRGQFLEPYCCSKMKHPIVTILS